MECRDVLEATIDRLTGEGSSARGSEVEEHLLSCERCREEVPGIEEAWARLGDDPDATPSFAFRRATLEMMEEETLRRRVRRLDPDARRKSPSLLTIDGRWLGRAAALLAAGFLGYSLARGPGRPVPAVEARLVPVEAERTLDVSRAVPDLSKGPRLVNVAFRPADASGRIGVSFDVTTRYTVVGRPEEKGIADVLAYLVQGSGETEGARGKAIGLVTQHYREEAPPSPQVVKVLVETLKGDKNPGVRKKAAEALAQLPSTSEIRDAFASALKADTNPAVRILAVEGLARAARTLRDPATIESLREKASDEKENGYVRVKAASALRNLDL